MMFPTNLEESEPPKVSRPLAVEPFEAGSNEMPIASAVIAPCSNPLSNTVGTICPSDTVPLVNPAGPILTNWMSTAYARGLRVTYPRMPSMDEGKPRVWFATEIPWFWIVTLPSVTVSVYCSPEKRPEP